MLPVGIARRRVTVGRSWAFAIPISVVLALIVGGCASVSGKSDYDRDVSFAALRTFVWVDAATDSSDVEAASDPFLQRRLRRSVESELLDRGFVAGSDAAPVDFVVTAYAVNAPAGNAARQSERRSGGWSFGVGLGFGSPWWYGYGYRRCCRFGYPYFGYPYWGVPYWSYPFVTYPLGVWYPWVYPWVGISWGAGRIYETAEGHLPGTLIVDVWDARTRQLIWRGWAEGALLSAPESEDMPAFIDKTIGKIMEAFPPES